MEKYVICFHNYDNSIPIIVCDTEADAQECLLTYIKELNYEDYLCNYVNSYTENDPFDDYWYEIKQDTQIRNSIAPKYQKHDWTPAGYELFSMGKDYIITKVDTYG